MIIWLQLYESGKCCLYLVFVAVVALIVAVVVAAGCALLGSLLGESLLRIVVTFLRVVCAFNPV